MDGHVDGLVPDSNNPNDSKGIPKSWAKPLIYSIYNDWNMHKVQSMPQLIKAKWHL